MRIEELRIRNLRAAKDLKVSLDGMTSLVGANGSGKTTILLALRTFFGDAQLTDEDYYNEDTGEDIVITAAFGSLGPDARERFSRYVDGERLEISCTVHWDGSRAVRTLHGAAMQNPDFAAVRAEPRAAVAGPLYEELAGRPEYGSLPPAWPGAQGAEEALRRWEDGHPEKLRRMPDGGRFFGPGGAGHAHLSKFVRFLHIPAAPDPRGGAGSDLDALLDITIQKLVAEKKEYRALPGKIRKAYEEAMGRMGPPEILQLGDALSRTLGSLVPGAAVEIVGRPPEPSIGRMRFDAYLIEDRYSSPVASAGHGLQRALAIAALHHLSLAQADGEAYARMAYRYPAHSAPAMAALSGTLDDDARDIRDAPVVLLAIEEPELHQHPARMRHLARLLRSLPDGGLAGAPCPAQVVYTTHSPHFVFPDRMGQIRLVRMEDAGTDDGRPAGPGTTAVSTSTLSDIMGDMWRCGAARPTDGSVDYSLMRDLGPAAGEGFFASAVVLVEGPSDRIVLEAVAEAMGHPLDSLGVSIVPCGSKSAMPLPIVVFRRFAIPVYAVWDADRDEGRQREESGRIASALGHSGGDWRGRICGRFACLEVDLERTVQIDLEKALGPPGPAGPHHRRILRERRALHGMHARCSKILDARLLMEEVREKRIRLATIESIVRQIAALAGGDDPPALLPAAGDARPPPARLVADKIHAWDEKTGGRRIAAGNAARIEIRVSSPDRPATFTAVLQVSDPDGATDAIQHQNLDAPPGSRASHAFSWTPRRSGMHSIAILLWKSLEHPVPYAPAVYRQVLVVDAPTDDAPQGGGGGTAEGDSDADENGEPGQPAPGGGTAGQGGGGA